MNSQRPTSHAHAQQEAHADPVSLATPRAPERHQEGQPQQSEMPYGCTSKAPSLAQSSRVPGRTFAKEPQPARNDYHGGAAPAAVQFEDEEPRMSPAYVKADDATWEQAYLAKVLQGMKDSEILKLKFFPQGNKALEYEKWL